MIRHILQQNGMAIWLSAWMCESKEIWNGFHYCIRPSLYRRSHPVLPIHISHDPTAAISLFLK